MEIVKEKLNTIRDNVKAILIQYPETRDSDRWLVACYLLEFHGVMNFFDYAQRSDLPSLETIRRRRQEIQEQGDFLPTEQTVRHRRMMADADLNSWRKNGTA